MQYRTPCHPLHPDQSSGENLVAAREMKMVKKKKCRAYETGECKFNPCKFEHELCKSFATGTCKHPKCRFIHKLPGSGPPEEKSAPIVVEPAPTTAELPKPDLTPRTATEGKHTVRSYKVQCSACKTIFVQELVTIEAFSDQCSSCKAGRPPPTVVMTDEMVMLDHDRYVTVTAPKIDWRANNGVRPESRAFGLGNYLRRAIANSLSAFGEAPTELAEAQTEMWQVLVPEECYSTALNEIQRQNFTKKNRPQTRARATQQSVVMYFQRHGKDRNYTKSWQQAAAQMDPTMTLTSYQFEVGQAMSFYMIRTWPRRQATYAHNMYANANEIEQLDQFVHEGETFTAAQCAAAVAKTACQGLCLTIGAVGLGLGLCGVASCDAADRVYPGKCGEMADTVFEAIQSCVPTITLSKARPLKRPRDVEFVGYAKRARQKLADGMQGMPSVDNLTEGVNQLGRTLERTLHGGYVELEVKDRGDESYTNMRTETESSKLDSSEDEPEDIASEPEGDQPEKVGEPEGAGVTINPLVGVVVTKGDVKHCVDSEKSAPEVLTSDRSTYHAYNTYRGGPNADKDMSKDGESKSCPDSQADLHWLTTGPVPEMPVDVEVEPFGLITKDMLADYRARSGEAEAAESFAYYVTDQEYVPYQYGVLCISELPNNAKVHGEWNMKAFLAPEYAASCVPRKRNAQSRSKRNAEFELLSVYQTSGAKRWFHTGLLLFNHPVYAMAPVDENYVFSIQRHYGIYPHQCDCETVTADFDNYCQECALWRGFAECTPWLTNMVVHGAIDYALDENSAAGPQRDTKLFNNEELLEIVSRAQQMPRPILAVDDGYGFQSWYSTLDIRRRKAYAKGLAMFLEGKFYDARMFDMTMFMKWEKASNLVIDSKSKLYKQCRGVCPSDDPAANAISGPPFRAVSKGLTYATRKWLSDPRGLPPDVMVTSGSTPLQIGLLHHTLKSAGYRECEFDMARFDSSQGRSVRMAVDTMMFDVIKTVCQVDTTIMDILQKSFSERLVKTAMGSFKYNYGWCSGIGATFQGNTFASIRAVLGAAKLSLKELEATINVDFKFMVLGDDSVLYVKGLPRTTWTKWHESVVLKLRLVGLLPEPVTSSIPSFCSAVFWPIKHKGSETTILAPELLRFMSRSGASFNWKRDKMSRDEARAINKGLALSNPHWAGLPVLRIYERCYRELDVKADMVSQYEEHKTTQDGEASDFTVSVYVLSYINRAYGLNQDQLYRLESELLACLSRAENAAFYSSPIVTAMARHFKTERDTPI